MKYHLDTGTSIINNQTPYYGTPYRTKIAIPLSTVFLTCNMVSIYNEHTYLIGREMEDGKHSFKRDAAS